MALKKVLIVLYYWPPAGGPGVQRWLKFVKYLPEFGITPIVYCPSNPSYPILDTSLIEEIPPGITILKQPIKEPYRFLKFISKTQTRQMSAGVLPEGGKQSFFQKLLLFIRGNFFIPDARVAWVKPSVSYLKNYIAQHQIKTLITTGPPHSVHLIGKQLKTTLPITWIADFRDPWTTIGYHNDLKLLKTSKVEHLKMEQDVLTTADNIIVTSYHTKHEFSTKTKTPITVITNGFDVSKKITVYKDNHFSITHTGSLLSKRNPKVLWQVLSELVEEYEAFKKTFQLNLVGMVSDVVVKSISTHGLQKYLNLTGYVSHDTVITYQQNAQLLLLIEIKTEDTKAIIPGKIFEYMVANTPIVALGPKDSDIEHIISETQTGVFFQYHQKALLKSKILNYFLAYQNNSLQITPKGTEKYSRKSLTKKLTELIKSSDNS